MDAGIAVLNFLLLIVGFVLLIFGSNMFVDGASGIAKKLKVSTFIIGATVVALGTSAPEMAVTVISAIQGESGLIVGNILGSNVINILLILGISAVICKLPVEKTTRCIDLPFLISIFALFILFGTLGCSLQTVDGKLTLTGGSFNWWEGLILLLLYAGFMAYNIVLATRQKKAVLEQATAISITDAQEEQSEEVPQNWYAKIKAGYKKLQEKTWFLIIITVLGLGMVIGGAEAVVYSAQNIAEKLFNIPTEIVGLTVVAFGTSLPELVTSVSAARKGDVGIATGNIIGSNIANILLIGGLGAVCSGANGLPLTFEGLISGLVGLFAAIILFSSCWGKSKSIGRAAGIIMLVCLVCYYGVVLANAAYFHWY